MSNFRNWPLAIKINSMLLASAVVLFGSLSFYMSETVRNRLEADGLDRLNQITHMTMSMIDAYQSTLDKNIQQTGDMFAAGFPSGITVDESHIV